MCNHVRTATSTSTYNGLQGNINININIQELHWAGNIHNKPLPVLHDAVAACDYTEYSAGLVVCDALWSLSQAYFLFGGV